MYTGTLFIISAPSGTGKSTLMQQIFKKKILNKIAVSVSHTTRSMRKGEKDGEHYYFVSKKEFKNMIKKKYFLEYAKIFNNYYGTSKLIVKKFLSLGFDIFLIINWEGAQNIRKRISNSKSIFLLPPSKKELHRRLQNRGQDSDLVIKKRMKKAVSEISHYHEYDYIVVNNKLKTALFDLSNIILANRLRTSYQKQKKNNLIKKLLNC
ncbi:guanylate kinase [Buchnera aphidicola (Mindarus keteleerifoliae)]|uniref:guanylate kinase n=1 Tax=Buchnera aphidicola TaxID=9 RepID=UPI0031B6D635